MTDTHPWSAALPHLRRDSRLGPVVRRIGPPTLRRRETTFHALARAILFQQVSGAAGAAIYSRLVAHFPGQRFPRPQQVAELSPEQLRAAGISRQKAGYLIDLASRLSDGSLSPRRLPGLSDDDVVRELTAVRGIGEWTAQIFLMFTLHRPDVLPVGDLGLRRGVQWLYELDEAPTRERMERLAEPWRPYRSAASWYLWRVADGGGI
ncbi:MAG TPA: DNA-3-methyladenine glycosylase [Thermoanaerobaculia bacterium]|nr:DNA-3-methyladenine glycosylase [Thermoanaerobaculia bacterium]